MRTLESTFIQIVGRSPNAQEKQGLDRLCGPWTVRGNQGLIALALTLHFGDPEFREFPEKYTAALRSIERCCGGAVLAAIVSGAPGWIALLLWLQSR